MAPSRDDDWSDSDEEELSEVETNVLLGVPDGHVDVGIDVLDAAVSRIGGLPALLPSREPPISSSHCKSCSQPMELLVQMWCPFEDSPMDRALYIWGCSRLGCQGTEGSVRVWRGLRYNEKYALKLEAKRQRKLERERANINADEEKIRLQKALAGPKNNPFAMAGGGSFGGNNGNMFGLGAQIFGGAPLLDESKPETVPEDQAKSFKEEQLLNNEDDECDSDADSEESLLTAMASTAIGESPWRSAPSYPAIYLSTMTEYLPAQPKPQIPKGVAMEDLGDDDKKEKGISWAKETYENSLDVDQVFERFTKRVGVEAEQCVRYELKGTPLPFASDRTFDLLWPAPKEDPLPVTRPDFKVVHSQPREYKTTDVPLCPSCNSKRVFECQLMPNLINVLRPTWEAEEKANKLTDVERRKAVERALKGLDKDQKRGMEWGTCMIFSCEKDCCLEEGKEVKEAWKEEVVYIQWDV